MTPQQELRLRSWLESRDPGAASATLRSAVALVPAATRPSTMPALDGAIERFFGRGTWVKPVLLLVLLSAIVLAVIGAALLQPWRPFPPRGLIAYQAGPLGPIGTSGIRLVAADGTGQRTVTPLEDNVYDVSPHWSHDGRTLLIARNSDLSATNFCAAVGSIVAYDVASGADRVLATGLRGIRHVEWSPSGNHVAFLSPQPGCGDAMDLGLVDAASGEVTTSAVESLGASTLENRWLVQWSGEAAKAIPAERLAGLPPDMTFSLQLPSPDGTAVASYTAHQPSGPVRFVVTDSDGSVLVDLGSGSAPVWAPDSSALAFIQADQSRATTADGLSQRRLVVASRDGWTARIVATYMVNERIGLSMPLWTADGGAIEWADSNGAHVVDVITGRTADLPAVLDRLGAPDELDWQPTP